MRHFTVTLEKKTLELFIATNAFGVLYQRHWYISNTVDPFLNATGKKCDPRGLGYNAIREKMRPPDPDNTYSIQKE